ncbi:MAG: hypothetical protein GX943_00430 [Candidatus Pacebacteria bacterium]|jgi:hypothetical protein|nr:hypothetical protein [Candidatus Paceibacterota bacterium]
MKDNTRKILLFLYPTAESDQSKPDDQILLNFVQLRFLLPDLSSSGFKSLLFYLEKKQYLLKHLINEEQQYSLTNYGRGQLEEQFPALSIARRNWHGDWTMIVFLQAIRTDQNFRYLRSFLLKNGCFALNRGIFLYPGQLNDLVLAELNGRYRQGVMVYKLGDCIVGDEQIVIGQKIALNDSLRVYSGISKELDELIEIIGSTKKLRDQSKLDFYSIYDRFATFLAEDSGLIHHYYPQVDGPLMLLSKLQKVAKI